MTWSSVYKGFPLRRTAAKRGVLEVLAWIGQLISQAPTRRNDKQLRRGLVFYQFTPKPTVDGEIYDTWITKYALTRLRWTRYKGGEWWSP